MAVPKTQIALQLYTLRDFMKTPADMADTFKKIKKIGYEAVQFSGAGPIEPAHLKQLLDENGIHCCAMHEGMEGLQNNLPAIIAKMKTVGCDFTALGSAPAEYRTQEGLPKLVTALNEIGKKFAAEKIRFGYHNHKFEFELVGKKTILREIFDSTNPKYVAAELDTFWVQYGGADPMDWIRSVKGRIPVAHIKDFTIKNDQVVMAEIGEGNLNWKGIFKALKEAKCRWYCVEQDTCQRPPFESIEISYRNLKKMGIK